MNAARLTGPSLGRTGAPCRDCSRWVSPARPPHPPCDSHRNGRSTCLDRWSAAGGGCRVRGPRSRYLVAAVAVTGHCDAGRAGEHDPVMGESPPLVTEASAEFFHPEPSLALVLGAYPAHDSTPRVVVDRVEARLGHPVPEVVRPPGQFPVEAENQLVQALLAG